MSLISYELNRLARRLEDLGIQYVVNPFYIDVLGYKGNGHDITFHDVQISIEAVPSSNRGRFMLKATSHDMAKITIDSHDMFPRYYFSSTCCATELHSWLRARDLIPSALGVGST